MLVSDGGGKKRAALRPIEGSDKAARWLLGVIGRSDVQQWSVRMLLVNGKLGFVAYDGEVADSVCLLEVDEDGTITEIYLFRNPDKLGYAASGSAPAVD